MILTGMTVPFTRHYSPCTADRPRLIHLAHRAPPPRLSSPAILGQSLCLQRSFFGRSEEHTSELQSQSNLVCRLLLEKKNKEITRLQANSDDASRNTAARRYGQM